MMSESELEQIFSILDENDEGQIELRRFVDIANNYYSDAQVSWSRYVKQQKNITSGVKFDKRP